LVLDVSSSYFDNSQVPPHIVPTCLEKIFKRKVEFSVMEDDSDIVPPIGIFVLETGGNT